MARCSPHNANFDDEVLCPPLDISALNFTFHNHANDYYSALSGSTTEALHQYVPGIDWTSPSDNSTWDVEPVPFANGYQMQQQDQSNAALESSLPRQSTMEAPQLYPYNSSGPVSTIASSVGVHHQIEAQNQPKLHVDLALAGNATTPKPAKLKDQLQIQGYTRRKQSRIVYLAKRFENTSNRPAPRSFIAEEATGSVQATINSDSREKSAMTRKPGACQRCRVNRRRCNAPESPYQPCKQCAMLMPHFLKQPCIRVDIIDLNLHRRGSTLNDKLQVWTMRKKELHSGLPSGSGVDANNSNTIFVTQEFGVTLELTVSIFQMEPGDVTGYVWHDDERNMHTLAMPPYYISDMPQALVNFQLYGQLTCHLYAESFLHDANPIIRNTFNAAHRYVTLSKSALVSNVLRLWAATRMTERVWRVCGDNTIGHEPVSEPENPWNGMLPVTPIMDTQLDELAIRGLLIPLKHKVLTELKGKVLQKQLENWFEIYLTVFIILCNVEWELGDIIDYTTRHGMEAGSGRGTSLSRGYVHACKTLLSYFHFACNGSAALSTTIEATRRLMTNEQVEYIRCIQIEISRQAEKLESWRDCSMYKTEVYWCYQMFSKSWTGDIPHAGPVDDFTEEDFLTS